MHDVFISYASHDLKIAELLCKRLEEAGIKCWYAPRDIDPGASWAESIMCAISDAKVFILLYSEYSNQSKQVINEVTNAFDIGCNLVPFRLTDTPMNHTLSFYLKAYHWFDAFSPSLEDDIDALCDYIFNLLPRDITMSAPNEIQDETNNVPASSLPQDDITEDLNNAPSVFKFISRKQLLYIFLALISVSILVGTGFAFISFGEKHSVDFVNNETQAFGSSVTNDYQNDTNLYETTPTSSAATGTEDYDEIKKQAEELYDKELDQLEQESEAIKQPDGEDIQYQLEALRDELNEIGHSISEEIQKNQGKGSEEESYYTLAVDAYNNQNYTMAEEYFNKIPQYDNCEKYLRLIRIRGYGSNIGMGDVYDSTKSLTEEQKMEIDLAAADLSFADTASVLLYNTDIACHVLKGSWKNAFSTPSITAMAIYGKKFTIKYDDINGYVCCCVNLFSNEPYYNEYTSFAIVNGELITDIHKHTADRLHLKLLDANTLIVSLYGEDDTTYEANWLIKQVEKEPAAIDLG